MVSGATPQSRRRSIYHLHMTSALEGGGVGQWVDESTERLCEHDDDKGGGRPKMQKFNQLLQTSYVNAFPKEALQFVQVLRDEGCLIFDLTRLRSDCCTCGG